MYDIANEKESFISILVDFKENIFKSIRASIPTSDEDKIILPEARGRIAKEKLKDYVAIKTTIHILFKYIVIRMIEDSCMGINSKLNEEGIERWREMSKNFRNDYLKLFEFASDDIRRDSKIGTVFEETIYDGYYLYIKKWFNPLESNNSQSYIEKLKVYNFKTLEPNTAITIIERIFPTEVRVDTQKYLIPSPVVDFLLNNLGLK